ncbi:hypothetical protein ES703_65473 [subsurface metagenome]
MDDPGAVPGLKKGDCRLKGDKDLFRKTGVDLCSQARVKIRFMGNNRNAQQMGGDHRGDGDIPPFGKY